MKLEEKNIRALINLGLHRSEAKVYLTLNKMGTERACVIAEMAQVSRPDVYRGLSNLHDLGLVEKIINNPMLFKSIPIKDAVSFLLRQKDREYAIIKSQSADLIRKCNNKINYKHNGNIRSKFALIPSKQTLINTLKKSIDNTQESIDVLTSRKRLKFACFCLSEQLNKAWKRGVCGRAILEKNQHSIFDFQKTCWKNPYSKVKYIYNFPKTIMVIYDQKEVFIFEENDLDLTESSALWSNNSGLVSLASNHFNMLWKCAREEENQELITSACNS